MEDGRSTPNEREKTGSAPFPALVRFVAGLHHHRGPADAHRLSRRIRAGTVWINCHLMYDAALPIGGVKQSGWGRDSGQAAMDSYLEWKTVCAVL